MTRVVLILGSGPNAMEAQRWPRGEITEVVAINNAWRVRADWDFFIHPDDLPADRFPAEMTGQEVTSAEYVPIQNAFGGFVYAGGTMAFTAGYWALGALQPDVMAFFGCDMVYAAEGKTHFYGKGTADPLREDVTLRSLEAKSARLMAIASEMGCACVNLSDHESRLIFPRATLEGLPRCECVETNRAAIAAAKRQEEVLGYRVASGEYWTEAHRFDPDEIDALDRLWLSALTL